MDVTCRILFQTQLGQQPVKQLVIQIQSARDLVGFDEDRLGFLGSGFVIQVLEVIGDWIVIQVEVIEPIVDPRRDGRANRFPSGFSGGGLDTYH